MKINSITMEGGPDDLHRLNPDAPDPYHPGAESEDEAMGATRKRRGRNDPTEDEIALAYTTEHGATLRYCHASARWLKWSGTHWKSDDRRLAFHYARSVLRKVAGGGTASTAGGVERFARSDPVHAATADDWDQDPWLLATPGGTVDLRTGTLRNAQPGDGITRLAGAAPVAGEPVRWLQFLCETFGDDPAMLAYIQRVAGYCLTGSTREHALFFGHGAGGNGKSVWLNILRRLLGDYAATAAMDTFATGFAGHPTDLAMLRGARLVTASETEEGRAWAEARIKQMTGGDLITARFMRQDFFTYQPQFKLLIIGNHAPALHNVDDAMRRRFNILPFDRKPAQPDPDLEQKLLAELPQIMAWAIEGCLAWQREGICPPDAVRAATADYFSEQDTFSAWIEDACETGPGKFEFSGKLYAAWKSHAVGAGENPQSQKAFADRLRRRGFVADRLPGAGRERIWRGLALKLTELNDRYGD